MFSWLARWSLPLGAAVALLVSIANADEPLSLAPNAAVRWGTRDDVGRLLTVDDDFLQSLSLFDLQARLQTDRPVTLADLKERIRSEGLDWTPEQQARIAPAIVELGNRLKPWKLPLPPETTLLQTTGREDANAPYTRGTAIVLPQGTAGQPAEKLQRLFAHELFHILSRRDKAFREQMYATIGFHLCEEIPLPVELRPRKITNPDAPRIDCYLRIATDDGEFSVAPVLYAQVDKFDPQAGRTLFQLLEFRLLKLTREGERWMPALRDGQPELLDPRSVASFHQQIGQNTGYIIHPDEVLADNFVHLVFGTPDDKLKTPALITRMKTALANWSTSSAASDSHQ